jgi:hypothetical protein
MNAAAFRMIRQPWNVALYYHDHPPTDTALAAVGAEPKGIVGVKFPDSQDEEYFRVRKYGRGRRMRIVRAARLFKQFSIRLDHTLKFHNPPVVTYHDQPMLLLDLDHAVITENHEK